MFKRWWYPDKPKNSPKDTWFIWENPAGLKTEPADALMHVTCTPTEPQINQTVGWRVNTPVFFTLKLTGNGWAGALMLWCESTAHKAKTIHLSESQRFAPTPNQIKILLHEQQQSCSSAVHRGILYFSLGEPKSDSSLQMFSFKCSECILAKAHSLLDGNIVRPTLNTKPPNDKALDLLPPLDIMTSLAWLRRPLRSVTRARRHFRYAA